MCSARSGNGPTRVKMIDKHTCDEFQREIREILLSFQGDFSKMYRIYKKISDSFQGDFEFLLKSGSFLSIFTAHFLESP